MILTGHAKKRFQQRFPGLVVDAEWASALRHRVTTSEYKRIRSTCPGTAHLTCKQFAGFYYKVSANGVVFVVQPPEQVVTVFPLPPVSVSP